MSSSGPPAVAIPESHADLVTRALPAVLVTLMPDGRPQASIVWLHHHAGRLSLNTEAGRQKTRNMATDSRATLLIIDPDDQHRYLELRCDVTGFRSDGALEHRAELDRKYLGPDHWTDPATDRGERLIVDLLPVRVSAYGSRPDDVARS
ncbi:MAG: TIGR03618 family F420-dependent PPOX class oxidoreductase [Ilumatobacter sp.]|uniref:TIGR03618 family F420-dependent PPOX class oxidoreductase n=1 Tax=Ilumatobacter sp. TaxID=1967498 RepID=UPI003299B8CA